MCIKILCGRRLFLYAKRNSHKKAWNRFVKFLKIGKSHVKTKEE